MTNLLRFTRACFAVACIAAGWGAPTARAAVSLSLVPDAPGPYAPRETIDVDVFLVNDGEGLMIMRLVQIDVQETDPRIVVEDFELDTSFIPVGESFLYGDFRSGTVYNWTVTSSCPIPCEWAHLQYADGLSRMGPLRVRLPDEPGEYVLDVLNSSAPDNNTGANFQWGFDPTVQAWSGDGTLTGGRMTLTVVPEPATGLLLLVGASALARRRRRLVHVGGAA